MAINKVKDGKLLYHLTKLSNLDSIIKNKLLPRKIMVQKKFSFSDVADREIISKRQELGLDLYTPFHFHPYSSFDVAVKKTYKNQKFIYICILRNFAEKSEFKILPRHPLNLENCLLMDYNEGFNTIDWETMHSKGRCDDYAKQVKMAECLTDKNISAENFQCIYVKDNDTKYLVEKSLKNNGIIKRPPYVDVAKWL